MTTRRAPIFGLQAGEGCLALVLDPRNDGIPVEDVEHPFVTVDQSGIFAHILLASVQSNDGQSIPAVVKIQKDLPSPPLARGFGCSYSNRDAAAAFASEARCLMELGADGEGIIPPIYQMETGSEVFSQLPVASLPITYCKKVRVFFHPFCPHCGEYLKDCRDEVLLAKGGLPSYAGSGHRFLYCPSCCEKSDDLPEFYTSSPVPSPPAERRIRLRIRSELYRDFHRMVNSAARDGVAAEEFAASLQQFPCMKCTYKGACYPMRPDETRPILAERLLHPVAYHEFFAIVRELYDMHYNHFGQLLGGRPWEEIKSSLSGQIPPPVMAERWARLDQRYTSDSMYFLSGSGREPSASEVLWLKLGAFEQLVEGVRRIYEHCGRPHLDLQPTNVMVSAGEISDGQPAAWSFRVGLTNPAASVPANVGDAEKDTENPTFLSRSDHNRLYTSPLIRRPPFGHEEYANVTIRGIQDSATAAEIEVDLVSEVIGVFKLTPKDRVKITLNVVANKLDGFTFWADRLSTITGGYRALGWAVRLRPDLREELQSFIGQTLWDCRANICRYYHAPCDLYSLGMIFFCSLLVNDEHDEAEICRVVEDVGRQLAAFASAAGKPQPNKIEQKLAELLAGNPVFFAPTAVLYRAMDRKAGAGDLPEGLWFACQKLGFAMTTEIDGFSLAVESGNIDPDQGSAPIKRTLDRLKDLNLWAEGRLFAPRALRRELRSVAGLER